MTNGRESFGEGFVSISRVVPEILIAYFWRARDDAARTAARAALLPSHGSVSRPFALRNKRVAFFALENESS